MSYPFCHDGEMSPREPRDNSSLATATTAGCDGRSDQNRLLKYNEATWLAKAFLQLAGKPLLLARWPPQFHFSFFNSRASLLLLRLKNFFCGGGSCYLDSSNRREELWANVGKLWCSSVAAV